MNLKIVKYIKTWIAISLVIIIIGFGLIAVRGFNLGVDFIGGSVIYASIGEDYEIDDIRALMDEQDLDGTTLRAGQDNKDLVIRLKYEGNQEEVHDKIIDALQDKYNLDAESVNIDYVGPTMGKELIRNALTSLLIAGGLILIYIWIRFELVSGVAAIIALLHDILIMVSIVSIIGVQINSSFIAAILTIVGYSINDTIVVFDRVRENTKRMGRKISMSEIVDESINDSITRSINTSLTTLFSIVALYIFGVESIKDFTLPIIVGIMSGTYSSIFIASPLWAVWTDRGRKTKVAEAK
ncbi:MAG TPA: protein translocase subunit SecF [Clostridia bacterium]|nr:protein translocase subunit SecF [Clostridia bacterium]